MHRVGRLAGLVLVLLGLGAMGCRDLIPGLPPGVKEGGDDGQAGDDSSDPDDPIDDPLTPDCEPLDGEDPEPTGPALIDITNIQPMRGPIDGGDLVEIIGFGFEPDMTVRFGPEQRLAIVYEDDITPTRIVCLSPEADVPGPVAVRVGNAELEAVEENAFTYYIEPQIGLVSPDRGPSGGGTLVHVSGEGLIDGTVVQFGTGPALDVRYIDDQNLSVTTPERPAGSYTVTVTNLNGSDSVASAFFFYDVIEVESVEPFAGPLTGGTAITVNGAGFVDPTALLIGTQAHTAVPTPDGQRLFATTLPAVPQIEGVVSVTAEQQDGRDSLLEAFVYYDAADDTPRVIAVLPAAGLVDGGGSVRIVMAGLDPDTLQVYFGTTLVACEVHDAHTATCTIPPGPAGTVDVRLDDGTLQAIQPNGFSHVDLEIDTLLPAAGARAGGTYVRIFGSGFGATAEVWFGEAPATDVEVVSAGEVVARTPRGDEGTVDVTVRTRGAELVQAEAFTYVDPFLGVATVGGGPIEGSLNVRTVANNGAPVPNAMVILGSEVDPLQPHRYGFTDERGELTLGGPDLFGPQDIHGGHTDFAAFSFIQMDRSSVTLMLVKGPPPPPDPLPECPTGSGLPPLLRGTVKRIKDVYNTGNDFVVVTTTYDRSFTPLPDPGPNSQMISQGDYAILSRSGQLAVIALAGDLVEDGAELFLDVHAMGIRPLVQAQASTGSVCAEDKHCCGGEICVLSEQVSPPLLPVEPPDGLPIDIELGYCLRVYEGLDVTINIPLDQSMRIVLEDPPYSRPEEPAFSAPTALSAFIYYDFGFQGLHPMESVVLGPVDTVLVDMPKSLPANLGQVPFTVSLMLAASDGAGGLFLPTSDARLTGLLDTREEIRVTPLLKTPLIISSGSAPTGEPRPFNHLVRPSDLPPDPATGVLHYFYDRELVVPCLGAPPIGRNRFRWIVVTRGDRTEFELPVFPAAASGANPPAGVHRWQLQRVYSPGASYDEFDLGAMEGWTRRSLITGQWSTQ